MYATIRTKVLELEERVGNIEDKMCEFATNFNTFGCAQRTNRWLKAKLRLKERRGLEETSECDLRAEATSELERKPALGLEPKGKSGMMTSERSGRKSSTLF